MSGGPVQQGSEEWLAQRRGKITGSRVASILGNNPYQSADDVMREMVREWFEAEREFQGNEATEWGGFLEPEARTFYERLQGVSVFETDVIEHPEYPFIGVSPDGLVGVDGCVEFKCPYYARKPYSLADKPYYRDQVQLVLETADLVWCDFLCYFSPDQYKGPGQHYLLEREMRSKQWFIDALPKIADFHHAFEKIVASKKRAQKYLRPAQERSAQPVEDPLFEKLGTFLERHVELKKEIAPIEEQIKLLRAALGEKYGDCTDGISIVQVQEKKGSVEWKRIVETLMEVPEIAESVGDPEDWRADPTTAYTAKLINGGE